jgi:hypothetical protein
MAVVRIDPFALDFDGYFRLVRRKALPFQIWFALIGLIALLLGRWSTAMAIFVPLFLITVDSRRKEDESAAERVSGEIESKVRHVATKLDAEIPFTSFGPLEEGSLIYSSSDFLTFSGSQRNVLSDDELTWFLVSDFYWRKKQKKNHSIMRLCAAFIVPFILYSLETVRDLKNPLVPAYWVGIASFVLFMTQDNRSYGDRKATLTDADREVAGRVFQKMHDSAKDRKLKLKFSRRAKKLGLRLSVD